MKAILHLCIMLADSVIKRRETLNAEIPSAA